MGLTSVTELNMELDKFEREEVDKPSTNVLCYMVSEAAELYPLPYVHEFDSRLEYINKIAKLFHPQIAYGVFNNTSALQEVSFTFEDFVIPPGFIDIVGQRFRINEPFRKNGIPRRVRWFENGSTKN